MGDRLMPIASRDAAVLAGILGGSGNHAVQITIVTVVAIVLVGYFLSGVGRRGGGGEIRAASMPGRARDRATSDASVRLVRTWGAIGIGAQREQWNVTIDGTVVGSIANKETVEIDMAPGHHTLRLGSGRRRSAERSFDVDHDEVATFSCHGPRFWPILVAAVINPDLWISLRRE
jgi:hypothetical protein